MAAAIEHRDVVVVGAGQAGLSLSHELTVRGVDHLVLERGLVGQTWRDRWDSFCLVTPNWTVQLPGGEYRGPEPDGFMPRAEIVGHLEAYAASFMAPVHEQVEVRTIESREGGAFIVGTSVGDILANRVVLATGAYQRPHRPVAAGGLPADLVQVDVSGYRNPGALPPGDVLVVGSGQSGCQIAEELLESGRRVVLSCGRNPWAPRRLDGRDIVWWLYEAGFLDATAAALSAPEDRLVANVVTTGHDGGHDLHLRTLRAKGVELVGHLVSCDGRRARFARDLAETMAWSDERHRQLMDRVRELVEARGWPMPDIAEPEPFDPASPEALSLAGFGAVVFAGGFRPDYRSWLPWPEAFDPLGFPVQEDGASTVVPGLYFIGVHFLRKRKSSILLGIGEDAEIVAGELAGRPSAPSP